MPHDNRTKCTKIRDTCYYNYNHDNTVSNKTTKIKCIYNYIVLIFEILIIGKRTSIKWHMFCLTERKQVNFDYITNQKHYMQYPLLMHVEDISKG